MKGRETDGLQVHSSTIASGGRRKLFWSLGVVLVLIAVITGWLLAVRFNSSSYSEAKNRAIGANVTVTGSKVPMSIRAVETSTAQNLDAGVQALTSLIQIIRNP